MSEVQAEYQQSQTKEYVPPQKVAVVDFQVPFNSMVWFMVKGAVAAIPALIIIAVIASVLSFAATVMFAAA